ncbi:hypothetical protein F5H01DRAFT_337852 [Linnemannia elongata]|nr:hypothetical protein F5H01DRAFT_337852 [Linnemannia elongata]
MYAICLIMLLPFRTPLSISLCLCFWAPFLDPTLLLLLSLSHMSLDTPLLYLSIVSTVFIFLFRMMKSILVLCVSRAFYFYYFPCSHCAFLCRSCFSRPFSLSPCNSFFFIQRCIRSNYNINSRHSSNTT